MSVPSVPRDLIRTKSTRSSITVKWQNPSSTGRLPIVTFFLELESAKDFRNGVNYSNVGDLSDFKEYEHTFRFLKANIAYTVRVSAYNSVGKGAAAKKEYKTVYYLSKGTKGINIPRTYLLKIVHAFDRLGSSLSETTI